MDSRACPVCHQGELEVDALHRGAVCSACGRLIEIDSRYSWGIPVALAILGTGSFHLSMGLAGLLCTASLVVFTSGYRSLFVRWLPLRHYGDSDP